MMLPPDPRKKKALKASWKTAAWIYAKVSTRKTAKAIARNHAMITAVAGTMAATGVAGYGVVQANEAKHSVEGLRTRLATVEEQAAFAKVGITNLRDAVARLDTKDSKALKALAKRLTSTADQLNALVRQVSALPPAANLTPLTARVADLAKTTKDAARKAELATVAAADQHDPEARAAAEDAFAHASAARTVAEKAEKDALAADAKAQAAAIAAAEEKLYVPHVYHVPNASVPADTGDVVIGSVSMDLNGEYKVALEVDGAAYAYDWYLTGGPVSLHGTGGEGVSQHQRGTSTYTFTEPTTFNVVASATGGDTVELSNITLALSKTRSTS